MDGVYEFRFGLRALVFGLRKRKQHFARKMTSESNRRPKTQAQSPSLLQSCRGRKISSQHPATVLLNQRESFHTFATFEFSLIGDDKRVALQRATRIVFLGCRIVRAALDRS